MLILNIYIFYKFVINNFQMTKCYILVWYLIWNENKK